MTTGLKIIILILLGFQLGCFQLEAQKIAINQPLGIPYTSDEIVVDGDLAEWDAYNHHHFADTMTSLHSPERHPFSAEYPAGFESKLKPVKSRNEVEAYLCWDLNYLYVAFEVKDRHLFAEVDSKEDNPDIYLNDGVEIYIDAGFDSDKRMDINDYQFIVDILNNSIVFKGDRKRMLDEDYGVPKDFGQNVIFSSAVNIDGKINDSTANSAGFVTEIRIPFVAIGLIPEGGQKLRIDLCNNDCDYHLSEAVTSDGKIILTKGFSWSGLNNFGFPDYWFEARLEGKPGWFERISYHARQRWIMFVTILFGITLLAYAFLFYRHRKLKRLPAQSEVHPISDYLIGNRDSLEKVDKKLDENQQILSRATEYINNNFNKTISSEEVASALGMSLRKLQRITKDELRCTPTNLIYIIKLDRAAEYLKKGKGNVSETAYEFGFSDPAYFSRLFKKYFGMSPLEYVGSQASNKTK